MKKKKICDSQVEMRMLVMPNDTNPLNTVFGGVVMGQIDMAASMVAARHSGRAAVTVHVSDISFKAPINVGEHCLIKAKLHYVGKTSMLIGVKVYSENPRTSDVRHTTEAFLVFVAIDDIKKPVEVPRLELQTEEEKKLYEEGKHLCESIKKK